MGIFNCKSGRKGYNRISKQKNLDWSRAEPAQVGVHPQFANTVNNNSFRCTMAIVFSIEIIIISNDIFNGKVSVRIT